MMAIIDSRLKIEIYLNALFWAWRMNRGEGPGKAKSSVACSKTPLDQVIPV